ncbi:MAG: sulfite exporter TauE/SafE family protein [Chloroflexi bacterium]|nr:sulfite exporter TauE/SafE family protein [Chloroflexota bacterium]
MLDLSSAELIIVIATALFAGTLGGITGMSTGIIALPVLAFAFGVREAVPLVTVAMLFNMTSRMVANRAHINYRVIFWYCLGAVPAAAVGGVVFANAPAELLARGLGIFLLALVVWRHMPMAKMAKMPLRGFTAVGLGQGFFSAIFGGAGPFGAHFFLSYGLTRNAFVGTVAGGTFLVNVTKATVYGSYSLMDRELLLAAVGVGLVMAVGAYIGAQVVRKVSDNVFKVLVEGVMVLSGVTLLIQGAR